MFPQLPSIQKKNDMKLVQRVTTDNSLLKE